MLRAAERRIGNLANQLAPQEAPAKRPNCSMVSPITTHCLDTALGKPAKGMRIVLEQQRADGSYAELGRGLTDDNGRITDLLAPNSLQAGSFRMVFDTAGYFAATGQKGFYPVVHVHFVIERPEEHYHVPLLVSPFGYSTYRGS
eukprot:tig00021582_g22637.t1